MIKFTLKFSTMVGEIFEYQYPQMVKIALKFFTMVGEIFKYEYSQMVRITLKYSKMVGEILSIVEILDFGSKNKQKQIQF